MTLSVALYMANKSTGSGAIKEEQLCVAIKQNALIEVQQSESKTKKRNIKKNCNRVEQQSDV